MQDDFAKFPPWDERGAFDFKVLKDALTRSNADEKLHNVPCPRCGSIGKYQLFDQRSNNAVGVECTACGTKHPFMGWGLQWVPVNKKEKRRPNDIAAVTRECGSFCYCCGLTDEELDRLGFDLQVHHAQQHARHGDAGKKIPMCSDCHYHVSAVQWAHLRTLSQLDGADE
jgi:hypothetical protein